jgi:hypothetical protein
VHAGPNRLRGRASTPSMTGLLLLSVLLNGCGPLGTPLTPLGAHPEAVRAQKTCRPGDRCHEKPYHQTASP